MAHQEPDNEGELDMTRRIALALATAAAAALVPAASALGATPFTAPTQGQGWDLAVGSDGTGHAVWRTDEAGDRVQYCRVPAGGSACDGESDLLSFPNGAAANAQGSAQVFTPAANKVVILASCWQCGGPPAGTTDRVYRWISNNNGVSFSALPTEVGRIAMNGQAAYLNTPDIGLGTEGTLFQGMDDGPSLTNVNLGGGFPFVYSPSVALVPGTAKAVYAVNDLDTVKYAVFEDGDGGAIDAGDLNLAGNWTTPNFLPGAEGDNEDTHLSSGPSGTFLTYRYFVPNDNRVGLRKFDPVAETFGGAAHIEGPSVIDNNSADYPYHSQDASGRLHVVWRTLHDGGRLRYRRSDDGGASFTAAANLAIQETFIEPIVEAGTAGTGFAIWGYGAGGATTIRIVPIDPQFEADPVPGGPSGPGGPGGSSDVPGSPSVSGFGIGDGTLLPGAGTTFSFSSSEAGRAVLSFHKRVKGLKVRRRGRRRCVPQTRARLRQLRRSAGSRAAYRRLLRQRRCKAWKRVGVIRREVLAGRNEIVWNGRVAGRRLSPGLYQARLVVRDSAGNVSRTERLRFRVQRRRR
jgi:hypothetical protein